MTGHEAVPPLVAAAASRAREAGFPMSCDPATGRLLAVLAAHLPARAKVLELGTGAGVGTAWITSGLLPRTDVAVTTVESDRRMADLAARGEWPSFVGLRYGGALGLLAEGGSYDLIFADAPDGKWHGLDRTVAALGPHGMLIVDDMTPMPDWPGTQRAEQSRVRLRRAAHRRGAAGKGHHPLPEALRRPRGLPLPARLTSSPRGGLTQYSAAADVLAFERSAGRPGPVS